MIKLVDLLKEIYIDKQGNIVSEADFIVLEGGMRGGIFKDKNQIDINDYINFATKLNLFRKKDIANKIYKQIISIYNSSALKKYNDSINFTPSLSYEKGGGWTVPNYSINLSNELNIWGALEPSYFYPETGMDNFIKQMRQTLNVDDSDFKDAEKINNQNKDSERFKDLDVEDLEDKIEYVPIICIPKFEFSGKTIDQFDGDIINKNFPIKDNHILYTKSNLLEDLNEIGLFLISKGEKLKEINEGKQVGILYHWTKLENLEDIIKTNRLNPGHTGHGEFNYISTTRSKDKFQFGIAELSDAVLVLNGNKISDRYKVIPYHDLETEEYDDLTYRDEDGNAIGITDDEGNIIRYGAFDEMEELIIGSLYPLDRYLIKIILYKTNPEIKSLLKEKNIPYEIKKS